MNKIFVVILWLIPSSILCITNNDPLRQDSYMSAYLDLQGSTAPPVGIVYAEPMRTYGPPQPKPLVYYGPPTAVHPAQPTLPDYHHSYAQEHYSYAPVIDILTKLPEKLEFLPKLIAGFLGITKILLKVVLLKLILKFIVMFCLFFFLPKLEMLDMATDAEATNTAPASSNNTGPHTPTEELEEGRLNSLNSITNFVFDSVENRPFLKRYCRSSESTIKCTVMETLTKIEEYATIARLLKMFGSKEEPVQ